MAIPVVLIYFVRRRRDLPYPALVWLFGIFILSCGLTHLMEVILTDVPLYWLAGLVKAVTAVASLGTVVALVPITPKLLALRSPDELAREVVARKKAEEALTHANRELERRVEARTAELAKANAALQEEVSERQRAEDELRRQREWLRITLASIGDGVVVTDTQERIAFLNGVAQDLTGWSAAEATGQNLWDVFDLVQEQRGQPDGAERVGEVLASGQASGAWNHTRLRARDGTERPVENNASPIRDGQGAVLGMVMTFRDVTERHRLQAELRQGERQLRFVTDYAPVVIKHCDRDGRYRFVNQGYADRFGLPGPHFVGKHLRDVLGPEAYESLRPHVEAVLAGRRVEFEAEVPYRDLGRRFMHYTYVPEYDGQGRVRGFIGVGTDVTERRLAEEALRASEERLRLALDAGAMGTWDWNLQTGAIQWSDNLEVIHGLAPGTFDGTFESYLQIIHPDDRAALVQAVTECVERRAGYEREVRLAPRDDGEERWMLGKGKVFTDEAGQPVRMLGVGMDVTPRKRLENELRRRFTALTEAEARIRSVVDHAIDGIITIDEQGRVDTFNPAAERLFGYSAEEVMGQNVQRLMPEPFLGGHGGSRGAGPAWVVGTVREVVGRRKDGSTFPVDLSVSAFHFDGRHCYTGIVRDVTERQRTEHVFRFLAEASKALAAIVDFESTLQKVARLAVPFFADWCAVDVLDPDGSVRRLAVVHVDPERVRLAHELQRRYPTDLDALHGLGKVLRTGEPELVPVITAETLAQSTADPERLRLVRELGLKSYVCVPLTERGKVIGAVTFVSAESGRHYTPEDLAVAEDLAHRATVAIENARLYLELREADRRKNEFLAILAHELRNPLAPLRNGLHVLRLPGVDERMAQRSYDMMERQLQHLVRLVDDLLDVSRIMRGKIELRKERIDLASVVGRAVETARPLIDAAGHQLTVELPDGPADLDADPVRLAQVIANLLNNAAKYTEGAGQISVRAERHGDWATLRVKDTGIGIAPDMLAQIFEPFVQADHSLSRSQGGMGIGLALVRRLVEKHGGSVWASSDGPGRGSEFGLRLPVLPPRAAVEEMPEADGKTAAPTPRRRVLVVDDNEDAANSLAMLLRLEGHAVRVVHSGPSALAAVREYQPEAVILDIGMPGMDGYEVARRLRALPETREALLAAMTGWGQEEDRRRSREAGFDEHLVKPVEPQVLEELLAHPKLR